MNADSSRMSVHSTGTKTCEVACDALLGIRARTMQDTTKSPDEVSIRSTMVFGKTSIFSTSGFTDNNWDTVSKDSVQIGLHKSVDVFGVRITPSVVSFPNAFENQKYTEEVSVQNISKGSVLIRILNPRALSFRVSPIVREKLLAPGLVIKRNIDYTCTKIGVVHSSLPIYIDDKCYEIPLEAYKGQAFVEILPTSIDFGRVDIGSKPVERELVVRNVSSCATKFLIDLSRNELDLQVAPIKGFIRPHSSITVLLQLVPLEEGEFSSEIWITTDLCQSRVKVDVHCCKRSLLALHPNSTSDFTLLDFPTTFNGCERYQTVVIYNMAAASSAFVVLADFGNQKQEPFKEAKKGSNRNVKMFDVEPLEGRIKPFEGKIFTVWFKPKWEEMEGDWKYKCAEEVHDFLFAIRIKRLQVEDFVAPVTKRLERVNSVISVPLKTAQKNSIPNIDELMKEEVKEKSVNESIVQDEISVLLCLYGEADEAVITIVPDSLHFTDASVGKREDKVLHVTNESARILAVRYKKVPFFKVSPVFKKIPPKKTCDLAVSYSPRNLGKVKQKLTFEVMAENHSSTDSTDFKVVNQLCVTIYGEVKSQAVVPRPKFNTGITPLITHEVGFLTDEVTFSSAIEKPKCAMAAVNQRGRPWIQTDATIAFPNDRPLTLRPRATDMTTKTIFKGLGRYIAPVDKSLTYTTDQVMWKKAHDDRFLQYIRGTAAVAGIKDHCCKPRDPKPEPDPPIVLFDKKAPNVPQDVLVPLTFIQLYRIRMSPHLISFGSVTANKHCTQLLTIENSNSFDVSARIVPVTSGVSIQTLDYFVVGKNSETKVMLTFQKQTLGKFSGSITCVINGYHSFDIAVLAEVVSMSLIVNPERVEYKLPEVPFTPTFVALAVHNPLNTPVSFSWSVPEGSPFIIEPTFGVSPKRGMVWCAAYFEPEDINYKFHPLKMIVEGVMRNKLKTAVTLLQKPNVYFLEPVLNIGYIPLKLVTTKRFNVFNPDFCDAMFVILNNEPVKGVVVEPHSGTVIARSCFTLSLRISTMSEGPLEFVVYMNVQNSATIELKVSGVLVYPQVDITPKFVPLNRVPCNSVSRTALIAENKSKARVEVGFNMEEYPQFKVSLSRRLHDQGISAKGFKLEPGSSQKFYLHFIPKDLASYDFYLPVDINHMLGYRNSSAKENEAHAKKLKSQYRSSIVEQGRKSHSMVNTKCSMSHMVLVDVLVLKPQLAFSELEMFFSYASESKDFTTTNIGDETLCITFKCEDSQSVFILDNNRGEVIKERGGFLKHSLTPGETVVLTTTFIATTPGSYITDVTVFVTQQHSIATTSYNSVRLSGTISPPCSIYPSCAEIYFAPVPLNTDISFMFYLTVNAKKLKKDTEVSYEINHPHNELFIVEFTLSNAIPEYTVCTIPVKLTFRSSYSVSAKKMIIFRGSNSGECTVNVIATADNSLLTTHAFLKSHSVNHGPFTGNIEFPDKTESDYLLTTDNNILRPNQHLFGRLTEKLASSDSLSMSIASLHATVSTYTGVTEKSAEKKANPKVADRSSNPGMQSTLNGSDLDLSLTLNIKEERSVNVEESLVLAETKQSGESMFPNFPVEPAITEYEVHMNQTLQAVQQWVYEQVFNCSYYPVFGSHTFCSFAQTKKEYGRSSPIAMRNVFDALERICGRGVRRYFTPLDKMPEDGNAKVLFIYNVYKQLLDFVVVQGALLCHVEPKYLMSYDDYCHYCKLTPSTSRSFDTSNDSRNDESTSEQLDYVAFRSISIQCWLDLFLQIFKTLILAPVLGLKGGPDQGGAKRTTLITVDNEPKKTVFSRPGEILLSWLTHHWNTQRTLVWPNQSPPARTVTNFDADLEDGLVLAAATAAYCPFLTDMHFFEMFRQPVSISQAYHNTVCLTRAWDRIKLGFSVTPRDFVRPNTVKMLMLVTHLYRILPSYKPESTVKFKAILNSSETQVVSLENVEESPITYHIEIFPNNTSFVLQDCNNLYVLKRKQKGEITVQYTARNTAKVDAILLLCGACMPPKFGRNYVFRLVGYPVKLPVSSVFNIISPLNTAVTTNINVESPHMPDVNKMDSTIYYDIWITDTEPQPENLNALCWEKEKSRKIPRRVFILADKLAIQFSKRQKFGPLPLQICCFSQATHDYWLIFMNTDIGDFIVKLEIKPGPPEPSSTITVALDPYSSCSCDAEKLQGCSRTKFVQIPCRNLDQWAAVRTMFELTISPTEKEFWTTYIESNIGFRLLQWMLEKKERLNDEIELIFKKSKTYKVTCESSSVYCAPFLKIANVREKTSVPLMLHFAENATKHTTKLTLTSHDKEETRCYKLSIV